MRNAASPIRLTWAAVLALLLSLRLIGATGYMPAFEQGRLTIIVCPDADLNAPLALGGNGHHHHHHHGKHDRGVCPYATAAGLSAVGPDWGPLLAILVFAVVAAIGRNLVFVEPYRDRERPPSRGPPILA